jgi:hypothetical protein
LPGAGFSGVFRFVSYLPGHLPLARTSAGNKYKVNKKEAAAETQLAYCRRKAVQGKAASGGALRHVTERKSGR